MAGGTPVWNGGHVLIPAASLPPHTVCCPISQLLPSFVLFNVLPNQHYHRFSSSSTVDVESNLPSSAVPHSYRQHKINHHLKVKIFSFHFRSFHLSLWSGFLAGLFPFLYCCRSAVFIDAKKNKRNMKWKTDFAAMAG